MQLQKSSHKQTFVVVDILYPLVFSLVGFSAYIFL
jgi:hypothetical protein